MGRCELIDEVMVADINRANPSMPHGGPWPAEVTLLVELTGPSASSVCEQTQMLRALATEQHGASSVKVCVEAAEAAHIWRVRKECLWSAMSQHPDCEPMITDVRAVSS